MMKNLKKAVNRMTYDEYRKEMRKLGWNDEEIDGYIEMFEKLISLHPISKETLKLEDYLRKPPVIYTASFTEETMEKYRKQSEED